MPPRKLNLPLRLRLHRPSRVSSRSPNKPWTGDFNKLLERRMILVFAPFSRSLYFSDKGRERGIAAELVRDWERYINFKYAKQLGKRPLTTSRSSSRRKIGTETTTYVRNIYKYYVAHGLTLDAQAEAAKARQQVVPLKN